MDFLSKFNYWKNSLLDLGKRNKLINFKETKRTTVTILSPDIYTLWNRVVNKEDVIEFPNVLEEFNSDEEDDDEYEYEEETEDFGGEVKTTISVKELQKTLRNLKSRAKISKEELGINSLYLGFGFLKWKEREDSDFILTSPLILVPIEIDLEDLQSPFTFSLLQSDDIIINPALNYKLLSDFGIDLSCDISNMDIKDYIEFVKSKIKNTKWNIEEKASIALLSFYKISMYKDLINNKDKIEESPIMQLIMGNTEFVQDIPEYLNNIDFDKDIKVKDSFQIVDADSSQIEAIEYAKSGISFVLQGPPGTGKSQTITNMIAELLAKGKKVLFVSSKMAALEVVYNRMIKTNLGDFCLSLHNPKTNKKEILKSLDNVLKLSEAKYEINQQANYDLEKLQLLRDKINSYYYELHTIRKPLNKTVFQINGEISKLDNAKNIIFDYDGVNKISQEEFNHLIFVLEEYVRTVGENTNFWKTNCWYGIRNIELTNEMRHNIGYYLDNLYNKLLYFNNENRILQDSLNIKFEITKNNYKDIIELLKNIKYIVNYPKSWFLKDNLDNISIKINAQLQLENQIKLLKKEILEINDKYRIIDITDYNSNDLKNIQEIIKTDSLYQKLNQYSTEQQRIIFDELKNYLESYKNILSKILEKYDRDILHIDYKEILKRFKSEYNSPLKIFNKNYKSDKKIFLGLKKEKAKNINDEEILTILNLLNEIDNIEYNNRKNIETWKLIYGNYFNGFETQENEIKNKIDNYIATKNLENKLENIIEMSHKSLTNEEIKEIFDENYDVSNINWEKTYNQLNDYIKIVNLCQKFNINNNILLALRICNNLNEYVEKQINLILVNYSKIIDDVNWFEQLFEDSTTIGNLSNQALLEKVSICKRSIDILEKYLDYKSAKSKCIDIGLKDFIEKIEKEDSVVNNTEIIDIFKKRFYRLWLDYVEKSSEELLSFRRENFETSIEDFKRLDIGQYKINQLRILKKIVDSFPNFNRLSNGNDEISILKRELNKSKKTMSLRKLFNNIPNLILTLKPCLMMSPLSVSIFLDSDKYLFDTVIFDEASQVKTEDAIGAIIRGKQVIVVGDNKQLPPTNFFTSSISEAEEFEEDYDDIGAYESILDEANLLPEKTLLWHYRSKYESLIAFSNAKFYNNKLITFPSNSENVKDNGVEFFYVESGRYDKGGRKGNIEEAKKVADLVFEHFRNNPERSLGVIAFGEIQQYAIENEINKKRIEDPSLEQFFLEDNEESFFVKNLENVQGDERDTIIFSIGYAKDNQNKLNMNFGPLSRIGGERRLNVAISRAKYNIKLVSSILPTDIEEDKISTEGPKLLKKYIQFAKDGISALKNEFQINDFNYFDSPFEESVYNILIQNGYDVVTQVGCSGYRIDMAVKNPKNKDSFCIGIECDGANYHSSRTARERDRLRQTILEDMGWKIYRIWSTDWIKNKEKESQKLLDIVNQSIENINNIDNINKKEDVKADYMTIKDKDDIEKINPYNLDIYKEYTYDYFKHNNLPIETILKEVIETEYPIHFDEICRRVSMHYLSSTASKKVKDCVQYALNKISNYFIYDDGFYMPKDYSNKARGNIKYNNTYQQEYLTVGNTIKYENPLKNTKYIIQKRPVKYIYKKELACIMKKIQENSINIDKISLFEETAKVLGLRLSSCISNFEEAYTYINNV